MPICLSYRRIEELIEILNKSTLKMEGQDVTPFFKEIIAGLQDLKQCRKHISKLDKVIGEMINIGTSSNYLKDKENG